MRLSIVLFAYGGISAECLTSHLDTVAAIINNKLDVRFSIVREDALISRSRCRAAGFFLKDVTDVLVMIDHDIEFQFADLWRMAELALEHNAIVGVPYSKRGAGGYSAGRPNIVRVGVDELVPAQFVASGFMAVPRGTLNRIATFCLDSPPPYQISQCSDSICDFVSLFQPFVHDSEYLSEDYAFCARARLADVPIFAWTLPVLKHWGTYGYRLEKEVEKCRQVGDPSYLESGNVNTKTQKDGTHPAQPTCVDSCGGK